MRGGPEMQWRRGADPMTTSDEFDYVIVGAGSAGCALAYRLTRGRPRTACCVLEFGGSDCVALHPDAERPLHPDEHAEYDWGYRTEPEPHLGGRRLHTPRGKVLGGSSSINGMVYVRGNAAGLRRLGGGGRARLGLRPRPALFPPRGGPRGGRRRLARRRRPAARRRYGPLTNPLYRAFIEAAGQAGYPLHRRLQRRQQEGFGRMDMTVQRGPPLVRRQRLSPPGAEAPEPRVATRALATRILFEGRRAIGVDYCAGRTREHAVRARARGDPLRRLDQLAAAPEALRHRPGAELSRRTASRPCTTCRASARTCRTTSSSTSRSPASSRSPSTPSLGLLARALIGLRWLAAQGRARRHQPFRELRLHPLARRRRLSRHPVSTSCRSPCAMTATRWRASTASRPMSARCARRAAAMSGCARATRASPRDPLQLYEPPGRLDRDPRLRPADARDLRAARLRSLSRARDPAGRRRRHATRRSTPSSAGTSRAPTTPAAPAAWAIRAIR